MVTRFLPGPPLSMPLLKSLCSGGPPSFARGIRTVLGSGVCVALGLGGCALAVLCARRTW